jgi:hypothetical protein
MLPFIGGYLAGQRTKTKMAGMAASANAFASDLRTAGIEDQRVERLVVVVEAMWELLKRHGYTDGDLGSEIDNVIARKEQAKTSLSGRPCPECSSRISTGTSRCQICGFELDLQPDPMAGLQGLSAISASTTAAAFFPLTPITLPPGLVATPHR